MYQAIFVAEVAVNPAGTRLNINISNKANDPPALPVDHLLGWPLRQTPACVSEDLDEDFRETSDASDMMSGV